MLDAYLTKKYLQPAALRTIYKKNTPFAHIVLPHFFQKAFITKVYDALRAEPFTLHETDLYQFAQTHDLANTSNPFLRELHAVLTSNEFKTHIQRITGAHATGPVDCAGFLYTSTDYLLPHDDKLDTRRIAYTLHLARNFTRTDGGALQLFDKNKITRSYTPRFNTLTLFTVIPGTTVHCVSEVLTTKKRYSIAGWYHDQPQL